MRRCLAVALWLPLLSWAGSYDYYECVGADGTVSFSVERCPKGEKQRKVADDTPPTGKSLGQSSGGTVRLESRHGGHFFSSVLINGVPVRALVDTGATTVAISPAAARRIGLNLRKGVAAQYSTANGVTNVTEVVLDVVELGGNQVRNVPGGVAASELGAHLDVLLGMSFLKHFEVNSDGYVMTLRPK